MNAFHLPPVFPPSCAHVRGHRGYEYSAHRKLIYTQNIKLQKNVIKTNMVFN